MQPTAAARLRQYVQQQSRFLSVYVDRHPDALEDLLERDDLNLGFSSDDLQRRLYEMPSQDLPPALLYASFRRRQLLRILKKAAVQLTELLSTHTPEGFCYRVDLRLRPEGTHGEV